jgi:uncharacterized protein YdeI (YjbR/CyaY-like superfamily)
MKTDPRVDAYIAKQADFARPILTHLRAIIHEACPDCEETLKWSMPSFMYKGKILAGFAAFKAHATFGYWNDAMLQQEEKNRSAMGQFGRLTSVEDLPDRAKLIDLTKQSMALVDAGVKPPRATAKKAPFTMPQDMEAALRANEAAKATYDGFPPSAQREYVEWVTEAKTDATRVKRLAQSVEWLAEGKRRHWKYENC